MFADLPAVLRRTGVLLALTGLLVPLLTTGAEADTAHSKVAQQQVSAATPDVQDGTVFAIAKLGSQIFLGGDFTQATSRGATIPQSRLNLLAFNEETGVLDENFLPDIDGAVTEIEPGPNGTIFVAGDFKTVDGQSMRVARLDVASGRLMSIWNPPFMSGATNTLEVYGNTLYVGGIFTKAGGRTVGGLVALSATTGLIQPWFSVVTSGQHSTGSAKGGQGPKRMDLTADGKKMVVIGNFTAATDSQGTTARDQVMLLEINQGVSAEVNRDWNTLAYTAQCGNNRFSTTVRDVALSPDGKYFVISATAVQGINIDGTRSPCDAAARFEVNITSSNLQPTWVAATGTDSLWAVAVTGAAVYIGGHQKWMNNDNAIGITGGGGFAYGGAVPRPGVAALDPLSGIPLTWNPGRHPRGAGTYALFASDAGLYVGSDTEWIGYYQTKRKRIAFFPLTNGTTPPAGKTGEIPGQIYSAGGNAGSDAIAGQYLYRVNVGGPAIPNADPTLTWTADTGAAPSTYHNGAGVARIWPTNIPSGPTVPRSIPNTIFASDRTDPAAAPELKWTFPVPTGTEIQVRVYVAERDLVNNVIGKRVFKLNVDGNIVYPNVDIFKEAGLNKGLLLKADIISDGQVDLRFEHGLSGDPVVSGIEVFRKGKSADVRPALLSHHLAADNTAGPREIVDLNTLEWFSVRGMFLVDDQLFYGLTDGTFHRRSFNGSTLGPDQIVDPYNDPYWSTKNSGSTNGSTYRGVVPQLYGEFVGLNSAFYHNGRLYYTILGSPGMQWRAFSPESGIIGALAHPVVDGLNWGGISGATVVGNQLYYVATSDGILRKYAWDGTKAVGQPTVVDSTQNWRGRSIFVRSDPA